MKELVLKFKERIIRWLMGNVEFLNKGETAAFDIERKGFVTDETKGRGIAILPQKMYVSFERKYKVISRKELKGVVENEIGFHAPFDNSYSIYRISEQGDSNWLVHYYFVDMDRYPSIKQYGLLLIWEEVLRYLLNDISEPSLRIKSPIGEQLVVIEKLGVRVVEHLSNSLRNRVLLDDTQADSPNYEISPDEFASKMTSYLLSLSWRELQGALNKRYFERKKQSLEFNPKYAALSGLILGAFMLLESAYLLGTDYYLDNKIKSADDLRGEYSQAKSQYLSQLEQYEGFASIVSAKSYAAKLPQLIHHYTGKGELRIDRMDYLEGEVRIGGISNNIQSFMSYLSEHPKVKGLEFLSPITKDSRTGKDRFSIKFDFINE